MQVLIRGSCSLISMFKYAVSCKVDGSYMVYLVYLLIYRYWQKTDSGEESAKSWCSCSTGSSVVPTLCQFLGRLSGTELRTTILLCKMLFNSMSSIENVDASCPVLSLNFDIWICLFLSGEQWTWSPFCCLIGHDRRVK